MKLGALLKNKRKEMGYSLAKLGALAGVSPTHIMNIEKGSVPTNQTLTLLAQALNLDYKEVLKMGLREKEPEIWKILQESDRQLEALDSSLPLVQMIQGLS